MTESERMFIAYVEGRELAKARSLKELVKALESMGVNMKSVKVKRTPPPKSLVRSGARIEKLDE